MQIGIQTAQLGRLASSAAVRNAARAAEQLGYASIWVMDRLPAAVDAQSSYPHGSGKLPVAHRAALDPLLVLGVSASVTTRIRFGASVLVAPWYRPVVLARSLTSLDVLSEGRLTVGLGLGWSSDEYAAAGVSRSGLGASLDELLDVLDAHWGGPDDADRTGPPDVIAFDGPAGRLVGHNALRPVQRPRPPVLLAASSDAGLDRVGRRAEGWTTSTADLALLTSRWAIIRRAAELHGRDPDRLRFVARATVDLHDAPVEGPRNLYVGDDIQVAEDLAAIRELGVDEVVLGLSGDPGLDEALDTYARLAEAYELTGAGLVR